MLYIGGLLIALCVGFLTGVFGIGGGFLMTPALMIFLNVPGPTAVGTDIATIFVASSFGLWRRRGTSTVEVKLGLTIAAGCVLGVCIGLTLLELLKGMPPLIINGRELVAVQFILFCCFVVLLSGVGIYMFIDTRHHKKNPSGQKQRGWFSRIHIPPYGHFALLDSRCTSGQQSLVPLVLLGLIVGTLTGLMGIGGGFILLPALVYLVGMQMVKAAGTSLLLVWISSMVAVILNVKLGNINFGLWAAMIVGSVAGTFIGTKIGLKAPDSTLRLGFVYVVFAAVVITMSKLAVMVFGP